MATPEYFRKQADLYSRLAGTTMDEELRATYLARALDFMARAEAAQDDPVPPAHVVDRPQAGDTDGC